MPISFTIDPLTPTIGAEVECVDVSRIEDPSDIAALRNALNEHQVLFFRDQDITPAQPVEFASHFGKITESMVDPGNAPAPGIPGIAVTDPTNLVDIWHYDHSSEERRVGTEVVSTVRPRWSH